MTRTETRKAVAEMTPAEREKIVGPGLTGEARRRFIEEGVILADQIAEAAAPRLAAEAAAAALSDTVSVKEAAKELQVPRSRVRKAMKAAGFITPLTRDNVDALRVELTNKKEATVATQTKSNAKQQTRKANTKETKVTKTNAKNKPAAKNTTAKKPAKKAAPAKQPVGVVTVADIAAETGVPAKEIRKVLRAKGVTKQDGGYAFPSMKNRTVQAVIKAVKA